MANPSEPAARVYAGALVQVGHETGQMGAIYRDLMAVARMYADDDWFRNFFTSPRIDREVKWRAVLAAFEGQVGRPVLGLLKVLITKGRAALLDNVAGQFEKYRDEAENRIHAHVTLATELPAADLDALRGRLERTSGKTVEMHVHVHPEALGGAAIRIGDRVIDRTLRKRLSALRANLLATATAKSGSAIAN